MTVYVYDPDTRLVSFTYDEPYPPGFEDFLAEENHAWTISLPRPDVDNIYVDDDGKVRTLGQFTSVPSKTVIENDGVDAATWEDLPAGTEIFVDYFPVHTGTSFSLVSTEEGIYRVELRKPRYKTAVFEVTVV